VTTEQQLIEAAKAGSAEAFADLARHYRERLLRFLLSRCTSFADAEDVLQDTLINAFRYIHSYDPRWRFSTWLYRIAIRNAGKLRGPDLVDVASMTGLQDEESDPLLQCIARVRGDVAPLRRRHVGQRYFKSPGPLRFVDQGEPDERAARAR
jgi:RNA polymerase sigma-70 factor (ECF subfamily)